MCPARPMMAKKQNFPLWYSYAICCFCNTIKTSISPFPVEDLNPPSYQPFRGRTKLSAPAVKVMYSVLVVSWVQSPVACKPKSFNNFSVSHFSWH